MPKPHHPDVSAQALSETLLYLYKANLSIKETSEITGMPYHDIRGFFNSFKQTKEYKYDRLRLIPEEQRTKVRAHIHDIKLQYSTPKTTQITQTIQIKL